MKGITRNRAAWQNKGGFDRRATAALAGCLAVTVAACGGNPSEVAGDIVMDGSSTVFPISRAIADDFIADSAAVQVSVDFSGTGGGFRKFCAGETDINNASRPISQKEMAACRDAGIPYIELPVAFDGLVVVVNSENDWAKNLTTDELKRIWEADAEGKLERWSQVRDGFPNRPLTLFGPGEDSGTFDYFTEAIVGDSGASRQDYVASEDDDVLATGVKKDPNALGYFGLAYYEANTADLKPVAIDSGNGPVLPSRETVERSEYQPLARPLFVYVNADRAQKNPALREFVEFYLNNAATKVSGVGYIPLPEEAYHSARVAFSTGEVGTVFDGKSQFDLTIAELLRKRAQF